MTSLLRDWQPGRPINFHVYAFAGWNGCIKLGYSKRYKKVSENTLCSICKSADRSSLHLLVIKQQ